MTIDRSKSVHINKHELNQTLPYFSAVHSDTAWRPCFYASAWNWPIRECFSLLLLGRQDTNAHAQCHGNHHKMLTFVCVFCSQSLDSVRHFLRWWPCRGTMSLSLPLNLHLGKFRGVKGRREGKAACVWLLHYEPFLFFAGLSPSLPSRSRWYASALWCWKVSVRYHGNLPKVWWQNLASSNHSLRWMWIASVRHRLVLDIQSQIQSRCNAGCIKKMIHS